MRLFLNILEIISILIVICFVLVCAISWIENRRLTVTRYQITDACLPAAFNGFHIVHLSDMHNVSFGVNNETLLRRVAALKPDVILITGDMMIAKPGMDVTFAADTINALSRIAPVYFSLGNHELRTLLYPEEYPGMWNAFSERLIPEIHLLMDESVTLARENSCIHLYGLNLTQELYQRFVLTPMQEDYLTSMFGVCDPEAYHIFMAHNPDYFKEYAAWGANLTFSGHVHGGLIRIPFLGGMLSPMVHFFPKYDKGIFEDSNKYMILSGGLGNHTFKFRVNNLPEIVSVSINQETV